ncbi:MAG: glutamate mutase L [Actinomycetota bacterium]|nr:glutamate mutase L [Actinomycetota bacterium]
MSGPVALCVDIGSTYTKGVAVDLDTGAILGTADHRTTIESDVMVGLAAVRRELAGVARDPLLLICSSAGGGLRLAVVGYEREISSEAGHRAALSAGARVVHVSAGRLDAAGLAALLEAAPDVVLLVGGTDGGESSVLLHNSAALASAGMAVPVVVAGNAHVRREVCAQLERCGVTVVATANVLPDIGELDPEPARAAIRGVFLDHVIGGKGLSADPGFAGLVRAVTPDAVLDGVAVLAEGLRTPTDAAASDGQSAGSVVVIDVGGATTDVYCVLSPDAEQAMLGREAVGVPSHRRTVEGDLGLRWSAEALLAAAVDERLLTQSERASLAGWVAARREVSGPPASEADRANELRMAGLAVMIALRRHVRAETAYGVTGTTGASARSASTVVLSGGAIRHASPAERDALIAIVLGDRGGARSVLLDAEVRRDSRYVLAAAGLLAKDFPAAAGGLVRAGGLLG